MSGPTFQIVFVIVFTIAMVAVAYFAIKLVYRAFMKYSFQMKKEEELKQTRDKMREELGRRR